MRRIAPSSGRLGAVVEHMRHRKVQSTGMTVTQKIMCLLCRSLGDAENAAVVMRQGRLYTPQPPPVHL
jgi:hypothetical protein